MTKAAAAGSGRLLRRATGCGGTAARPRCRPAFFVADGVASKDLCIDPKSSLSVRVFLPTPPPPSLPRAPSLPPAPRQRPQPGPSLQRHAVPWVSPARRRAPRAGHALMRSPQPASTHIQPTPVKILVQPSCSTPTGCRKETRWKPTFLSIKVVSTGGTGG